MKRQTSSGNGRQIAGIRAPQIVHLVRCLQVEYGKSNTCRDRIGCGADAETNHPKLTYDPTPGVSARPVPTRGKSGKLCAED